LAGQPVKIPLDSLLTLLILGALSACTPQSPSAVTTPTLEAAALPQVGEFTPQQLIESGVGGCGMTLRQPDSNRQRYVFFHGLEPNSARMVLNEALVPLRRITAKGDEFYGQQTFQTFESLNGAIQVEVEVQLGDRLGMEVVQVQAGTIRVQQSGQEVKIPVVGDAGC